MTAYFINESDFLEFLKKLIQAKPVMGPVAQKDRFCFEDIETVDQLRLDYDVSILPPKKAFFPPVQRLLDFGPNGVKSAINPREQVLFGVHFYDVKSFDQLDKIFAERFKDNNYLANRNATTIVAMTPQNVNKRAFFGTFGREVEAKGYDAYLTRISSGYVFETKTEKGEALVKLGKFAKATSDDLAQVAQEKERIMNLCGEKVEFTPAEISAKTRASFGKKELWDDLAKDCFSCGACNIVCPTCYCFDVQDKWNLDQVSGYRERTWDACLAEDFAKVSLGGGHTENFREKRGERYRHRIMRKLTYLNEKLGAPACVGCGRCTVSCVPDIASPVAVINRIMKG